MIIECINCNKIFEVNSELIPSSGRTIQCGSCGHVWFYKYDDFPINKQIEEKNIIKKNDLKRKIRPKLEDQILSKKIDKIINKKDKALIKYEKKSKLTFINFLGYIIVTIISLIALIIILDTFQTQFSIFYPNLELVLFNLYETINDIYLFIKDLIK
tara:strand:- start:641 stop:1111 length:471 start_codon:yes stop_codon:yes gene_type:complete